MLFEQYLKAITHKTEAVWRLSSHRTNHPSKTSKSYWVLLDRFLEGLQRSCVHDEGEPLSWRTSAKVKLKERWVPPNLLVQDTSHVDDNYQIRNRWQVIVWVISCTSTTTPPRITRHDDHDDGIQNKWKTRINIRSKTVRNQLNGMGFTHTHIHTHAHTHTQTHTHSVCEFEDT